MKNVLLKDFIREIKKSKGRFLSIFFIVLLGAALFSGIRSAGGDMKYSADVFFDDVKMMDIRVLSTLGLTDEDISDISEVEGVERVIGGYASEALVTTATDEYSIKIIGETYDINLPTIYEGRDIASPSECLIDDVFFETAGYKIGDTIALIPGTDEPLSDSLKQTEFKIVGTASLPYYLDLTRGTGSIGDGQLSGFILIQPEVFDTDVFTEAYVSVEGAEKLSSYSDEYTDLCAAVSKRIEEISDKATVRRYNEIMEDSKEAISDGEKEIADAEKKLADAKKELDDAETELVDGKKELDEAEKKLADAKKELDEALILIEENSQKLSDAKRQLDEGFARIEASKAELAENEEKLILGQRQLDEKRAELNEAYASIAAGRAEIAAAYAELDAKSAEIAAGYAQIEEQQALIEETRAVLEDLKAKRLEVAAAYAGVLAMLETDPDNPELLAKAAALKESLDVLDASITKTEEGIAAGEAAIAEAKARLDAGAAEISAAKEILAQKETELDAAYAQADEGAAAIAAAQQQIDEGFSELEAGKETLNSSEAELNAGKAEYDEGVSRFEDGRLEYENGLSEYGDGVKKHNDGLAEYNDGLKKWQDGKAEYDDSIDEALEKIDEAKAELEDAKTKLVKLEIPKWYVLDRDKIQSVASFGIDAERMDSLGNVFPVLFFIVAALVSLTAMTRMVEEQRQQTVTLKALGYDNSVIAGKYVSYALLATLTGAVCGVIIGEIIFPYVIMWAYIDTLYVGVPRFFTPPNFLQGFLAVIISAACTGFAAYAACRVQLNSCAAQLMRPEAPKSGKKVFLENISFIWSRLSFTYKATIRNLFRYKKRFIMTIIGIGGCMGLMLVGFGIRDSITVVAQNQYIDIFRQEASVTIDPQADKEHIDALYHMIENYDGIYDTMEVMQQSVTLKANGTERSAILYVPETLYNFDDFVRFRDRISKEIYEFPETGCVLSEKTADMLNVKAGDTITVQKGDTEPEHEIRVSLIVENYVQHYIFMNAVQYGKTFGEEPEINYIYMKYNDTSDEYQKTLGMTLLDNESCSGISYTTDLEDMILDMLKALDIVIWVLIFTAALLAFVVLFNLNSISMMERRRELATLKVLGFYDPEVAMYVYRENIILTIIGIAAGVFIGKFLHRFTILTVEVDLMMFGREITVPSYVICAVISFAFSVIINLIMYRSFKKIDMIESLKSVE